MRIHNALILLAVCCCATLSLGSEEVPISEVSDAEKTDAEANTTPPITEASGEGVDSTITESTEEETVESAEAQDESLTGAFEEEKEEVVAEAEAPVQSGPLIDLFGPTLYSLEMVDETHAALKEHYTNDILSGKKVIGLYFSADWCGPCRQFTPDLVSFYNKMNQRRGKQDEFEIIWVSRCRDLDSYGQYFTHMNWLALPPQLAMGEHGQMLSEKYKVKGIPSLVLLDEVGNVITTDARNKIPQDKAGIGFPWRNPVVTLYMTVVPKTLRLMVKTQIDSVKDKVLAKINMLTGRKAMA